MTTGYILCSNPRSGTTLLCDLLVRSGVAGRPDSFFGQAFLSDWAADWGVAGPVDPQDPAFTARYFAAARTEGGGDTGTFGMRLMAEDLAFARDWLARAYPGRWGIPAFEKAFGPLRLIHLRRRDTLAEAVSLIRARQSGLWHRHADGRVLEALAPNGPARYDAAAIAAEIAILEARQAEWEAWFAVQGADTLRLDYEALAADPAGTAARALSFIGQDPARVAGLAPGTRRLSDATSAAWMARCRAETGAG
jgi:trehalose 2-sulfotransferase